MVIYQVILCMISVWTIVQCYNLEGKNQSAYQLSQMVDACSVEYHKFRVTCSGLHLTQIPSNLSNRTKYLLLNDNLIERLLDSSFVQVPQLLELDVSSNRIVLIEHNAFTSLRHLLRLDLSDNPIGAKSVGKTFCNLTSIKSLFMKKINFKDTNTDSFQCLQNTSVGVIDVRDSYNFCHQLNGTFSNIPRLTKVRLSNSGCKKFSAILFENDTKLEDLSLNNNKILNFPSFLKNGKPVLVNIWELDLSYNRISTLPSLALGLNSLKKLNLSNNYISKIMANSIIEFKSLEYLNINYNQMNYIQEQGLRSDTLKYLETRGNRFFYGVEIMAFKYTTAIEHIYMTGVKLAGSDIKDMFQNISTLKTLTFQSVFGLHHIPQYSFRGLYNLRSLTLSVNEIQEIHWFQFKDLISLTSLHIDSNYLTTFNITSLPKNVLHNLTHFKIENNPLHCTCDLLWFKDWMQSNIHKFGRQERKIYCALPEYKLLLDMNISAATCLGKPVSRLNQVVWALTSITTLITLLCSSCHRFRWHIRYYIFNLSLWMKRPKKHPVMENNSDYKFDVFVAYNSEDSTWVMNVLVPELEVNSEPPLKLCLFERDWMPGNDIVTLIGQSIEESSKTLIILTNAFAQSEWCQLELTMAQQHMVEEDKENIVLVIMEELLSEYITPRLKLEMKQRTYLEYTWDTVGQELFWQKLKYTLHKQNTSLARAVPHRDVFL